MLCFCGGGGGGLLEEPDNQVVSMPHSRYSLHNLQVDSRDDSKYFGPVLCRGMRSIGWPDAS